ncbi:MAG: 50S ribosomal protein L4 [Gemmataceae bacterium]|nr:50S ribosomal protein L4 [Gemmataceae bacterium]
MLKRKRKEKARAKKGPSSPAIVQYADPITVPVHNRAGQQVGTVTVDPKDYGGKISKQLMHDAVLMYRANQRAGTHSTLRRGEVAGSTKKLFRQKGTGNARAGTKRTNKRRGGGTAKGPKPRDYSYSMPKKAVRAATRMAILSKFIDNEAVVVEDLALPAPKTKEVAAVLRAIKVGTQATEAGEKPVTLADQTVLIGTEALDPVVHRSARNIEGVKVLPVGEFNCYRVLRHKRLLLTRAAFEYLKDPAAARERLAAAAGPKPEEKPIVRRGRAGRIQKRKAALAAAKAGEAATK